MAAGRSLSIATRVSLLLAGLVTVVLFIAGGTLLWYQYLHERELLRQSNRLATTQAAVSLSLPIWNYDGEQIRKILQGLLEDPQVFGVALRDGNKLIGSFQRDAFWNAVETNAEPRGEKALISEQAIFIQEQAVGQVRVFTSQRFLVKRMGSSAFAVVGIIAFIDLLLILGIYGLFWRFVLKPLRGMERFAEGVSKGQPALGGLSGETFQGELASLRRSLERMVDLLSERYRSVARQAAFNRWLAQVLDRFAGSLGARFDIHLNAFLGELAVQLEAEQVFLVQVAPETASWRVTHAWSIEGVDSLSLHRMGGPAGVDPQGEGPILSRERIRLDSSVPSPADPPGAGRPWARLGWKALLQVPLIGSGGAEGPVRGALVATRVSAERAWTDEDEQRLMLFVNAIATALERRQTEAALKESEQRYRALFENSGNAILILQEEVIIDGNDKALSLFGCSREDLLGRPLHRFFPPSQPDGADSASAARSKLRAALAGRGGQTFEWQHARMDGSLFESEVTLNAIQVSSNLFLQAIVRDVTEQRRAEELRRRQTETLLQNDKIMALGELAAGMAHEITQPLSGISLAVQALGLRLNRGEVEASALRDGLKGVGGYVERISRLIEHVRMFSRDRRTEARAVFDAKQSVEHAVHLMGTQYANHGVALLVDLPADPMPVEGNLYELEQVLLNLLANAKYAVDQRHERSGGSSPREIRVRLAREGGKIRLAVRDNGSGIPDAVRKRLFEPFFTTKPVGEGTGLGLSISLGIVTAMKGSLRVDSREGEFTEVMIELPAAEGPAAGGPP